MSQEESGGRGEDEGTQRKGFLPMYQQCIWDEEVAVGRAHCGVCACCSLIVQGRSSLLEVGTPWLRQGTNNKVNTLGSRWVFMAQDSDTRFKTGTQN